MFSKACEYGIRAVIYIYAASRNDKKVGIKEISEEIGSPAHFTGKTLQMLSRQGIISSVKGPNGGFFMDETQGQITLLEIVRTIDGDGIFRGCGLGLKNCSESQPCPIHEEYKAIRDEMKKMLNSKNIKTLSESLKNGKAYLSRELHGIISEN